MLFFPHHFSKLEELLLETASAEPPPATGTFQKPCFGHSSTLFPGLNKGNFSVPRGGMLVPACMDGTHWTMLVSLLSKEKPSAWAVVPLSPGCFP